MMWFCFSLFFLLPELWSTNINLKQLAASSLYYHRFSAECKCEQRFTKMSPSIPKKQTVQGGEHSYTALCMRLTSELCGRVTGPCYASKRREMSTEGGGWEDILVGAGHCLKTAWKRAAHQITGTWK